MTQDPSHLLNPLTVLITSPPRESHSRSSHTWGSLQAPHFLSETQSWEAMQPSADSIVRSARLGTTKNLMLPREPSPQLALGCSAMPPGKVRIFLQSHHVGTSHLRIFCTSASNQESDWRLTCLHPTKNNLNPNSKQASMD